MTKEEQSDTVPTSGGVRLEKLAELGWQEDQTTGREKVEKVESNALSCSKVVKKSWGW